MTSIRFHLDEQVANAVAEGLRRRGIDVTTTPEMKIKGVTDEIQLSFALEQKRVIFTQDDDFLKIHYTGNPHAGIVYCHPNARSIGQIIRGLVLIWEVLTPDDMEGHLEFL
jgi:predicted nuclease of predicted toxin-antitoxin system